MHIVQCCQLAIFTPRRQIFPPCFKGKTISTSKLCSTKTSPAYSSFVLMKVRHIFDRVCLQRVHFSFLRTLTCLQVQLLYIMVKVLALTHVHMNSNLCFYCIRIGFKNTQTFVLNNCHQTSYKFITSLT
jgi:hypothetical protein